MASPSRDKLPSSAPTLLAGPLAGALAVVVLTLALLSGASTGGAQTGALPVLPHEAPILLLGNTLKRGDERVGRTFKRLIGTDLQKVRVRIRCRSGCPGDGPATRRFVRPKEMRGQWILNPAVVLLKITRKGWIGLFVTLRRAGGEEPVKSVLCLWPGAERPRRCPAEVDSMDLGGGGPFPTGPAPVPPPPGPPADRETITSVDGTNGDRAPFSSGFNFAHQSFVAATDTVTYLGVTVGNPNLPVGPSPSDDLVMRLCESASCAGTELASASPPVNNYGLTSADVGDVSVVPGETYYLRWVPPENSHGAVWSTFWHAGQPTIEGSERMEAIVRGYEELGAGPSPARRAVIHYGGSKPPPAPFSGPFAFGSQSFEAASDTITKLGVVLGNPKRPRGSVGPQTVTMRLCETPDCATGILATATPEIVNYGLTRADIGDVPVSVGEEYFVYWQAPAKVEGADWISFWHGAGPQIEESTLLQAFARGYNRSGQPPAPVTHEEQAGAFGVPTFGNPHNASGQGPAIGSMAFVEVSCRLFAPEIQSVEPDGYWYRIHSPPWNDLYYGSANSFWNGAVPGGGGEVVDTDFDVPDCRTEN
ncbi:MAG: hypothetical protein ABW196_01055 [Solirubrobacterales bacterium]